MHEVRFERPQQSDRGTQSAIDVEDVVVSTEGVSEVTWEEKKDTYFNIFTSQLKSLVQKVH